MPGALCRGGLAGLVMHWLCGQGTTVTVTLTPTYASLAESRRAAASSPGKAAPGAEAVAPVAVAAEVVQMEPVYLLVEVVSGTSLPVMDSAISGGKCDPYCKVPSESSIHPAGLPGSIHPVSEACGPALGQPLQDFHAAGEGHFIG